MNTLEKIDKLIDTWQELGSLLSRQALRELGEQLPLDEGTAAAPKIGKKVKTRSQGASTAGVLEEPALAALTEEESKTKVLDVANAFVERFKKAPEGSKNGYTRLKEILSSDYKTLKLADLVHSQRLALITRLNTEMAA